MTSKKVSVKGVARHQRAIERKVADVARRASKETGKTGVEVVTTDSFVNFAQKMGVGADNPTTTASYGFNPITRIRTVLEWVHRGSWLGGVAVDLVADDMTREGVQITGPLKPDAIQKINTSSVKLGLWRSINAAYKWARLYGGAIAVMCIEGQDNATPLREEAVGKDQFKGLLVLDRWMVEASTNELIDTPGPEMGLPKFYYVRSDAPGLRSQKIHYSRCLRLIGIEMPYWQAVMEQMWGISVLERLWDRMTAFDSATAGIAQLIYKAWIRTYKIEGLRNIVAAGGAPLKGLLAQIDLMRRTQSAEGITLMDLKDEMEAMQTVPFSGLSDAAMQLGQQLSGALQIPLVRLFGQSPTGLNSTGESDLRMYYDNIAKEQNKSIVPITTIHRVLARSLGIALPEDFGIKFKPLWQLSSKEKAEVAEITGRAVEGAEGAGLISQQTAMRELKQSSEITGIFSNLTDEDINAAEETLPPAGEEAANLEHEAAMGPPDENDSPETKKKKANDAAMAANDAVARAMDAMAAANSALAAAIASMPQPQNITVNPAAVSVTGGAVSVAPAAVSVTNEVQPAKAADVHLHNVVQPAAPAAVSVAGPTIINDVKTFPSKTTETITRNKENEIVKRDIEHKP